MIENKLNELPKLRSPDKYIYEIIELLVMLVFIHCHPKCAIKPASL